MWLFDPDKSVDLGFVSPLHSSIIGQLQFTVQVFLIFCVFQLEKVHGGARPRPRPIFVQPQESSKLNQTRETENHSSYLCLLQSYSFQAPLP